MEDRDGTSRMTRRDFLREAAAAAVLSAASPVLAADEPKDESAEKTMKPAQPTIPPRRCGFNIHNLFYYIEGGPFQEHDFRWMADWGFDFARIPVAYTLIVQEADPHKPEPWFLAEVDRAVDFGQRYGVHISLELHRAPGYPNANWQKEPYNLWKDESALEGFCFLWASLAERYKGVPSSQLSFDLVNEPPEIGEPTYNMSRADYDRVIGAATRAIREVTPDRFVIAEGMTWGNIPCPELKDLGIGQSCHIYLPIELTHYRASWMKGSDTWAEPIWPNLVSEGFYSLYGKGIVWNRERLEQFYQPWFELAKQGVWVHCGEIGAYNKTPYPVVLAWFRDVLAMLKDHGIGFALWNFRGEFGILDSGRSDVDYEDFHGHKLDRKLLSLLQEFA